MRMFCLFLLAVIVLYVSARLAGEFRAAMAHRQAVEMVQ